MESEGRLLRWHAHSVALEERRELCGYKSCAIWFTGLPSSGKSTLANSLCRRLHSMCVRSYVLDGDNVRHGLNKDLGFSPEDRTENIRRIAEVTRLFVDAGLIALAAFISPFREDRSRARRLLREGEFIEVFVKCPPEECERRDPKGMYKKARAGQIQEFTGVSAPYEEPLNAEIVLDSSRLSVDACTDHLVEYLIRNGFIRGTSAGCNPFGESNK
jgi:adenylylsulfate kinase